MCDLTTVNPTKDSFNIGVNVNQPCVVGIYAGPDPNVGSGTVVTYVSCSFLANGNYDALGQSGSWKINLTSNNPDCSQQDCTWNVDLEITGSESSYSKSFQATCTSTNNGHTLTFQSTTSGDSVQVNQDNGTWFTDGKILVTASWVPFTVFLDANT